MTEDKVMEEQAGFQGGRGHAEQKFGMKQLAEKMIEKNKKMYAVFENWRKRTIKSAGRSCEKLSRGIVCPKVY